MITVITIERDSSTPRKEECRGIGRFVQRSGGQIYPKVLRVRLEGPNLYPIMASSAPGVETIVLSTVDVVESAELASLLSSYEPVLNK